MHGVYKPGNVKLRPELLGEIQEGIAAKFGTGPKPLDLVFHGGSGSTDEEIALAVANGVIKMNIDTDTQYAFTRAVADFMFSNYDGVLKVDGEVGNKKVYDPRAWGKVAESAMAARVVEATQQLGSAGKSHQLTDGTIGCLGPCGRGIRRSRATPGRRRRRAVPARRRVGRAISIASPACTDPLRSTRRYGPSRRSAENRLTHPRCSAPPTRRAKVWHGVRGIVTSTVRVSPMRQISPMRAAFTSMPSVRRFSPNHPGGRSRPSSRAQWAASSWEYA